MHDADGIERTMAEGNLAVESGQQVQPENGDGVDQDLRRLEYLEIRQEPWQHHAQQDRCRNQECTGKRGSVSQGRLLKRA